MNEKSLYYVSGSALMIDGKVINNDIKLTTEKPKMVLTVREALLTVLDQVDYSNGACRLTEMVGAVLPVEIIALAREALAAEEKK